MKARLEKYMNFKELNNNKMNQTTTTTIIIIE
jgi:hypothetical protein